MTDHPIAFSAPMVAALRAGTKTQTRRILNPQPYSPQSVVSYDPRSGNWMSCEPSPATGGTRQMDPCRPIRIRVGDRLWVRESYYQLGHWKPVLDCWTKGGRQKWAFVPDGEMILFREPQDEIRLGRHSADPGAVRWHKRLGRFMPRSASRMSLIVTDVRVERLQSISHADALAEGVEMESADPPFYYVPGIWPHSITAVGVEDGKDHAQRSYAKLWDYINGTGAWAENPWVVAYTFEVERAQ